eukprot:COSAG01_NODE_4629_length_4863_cov_4.778967_7_plen_86_part_00
MGIAAVVSGGGWAALVTLGARWLWLRYPYRGPPVSVTHAEELRAPHAAGRQGGSPRMCSGRCSSGVASVASCLAAVLAEIYLCSV